MNKTITRAVCMAMGLLILFSLSGCGKSRDERAADRILEALQEKYGEEFVLDGIGGSWGTMNNNTLKAIVRPKNDLTIKVPVEITKDLNNVYDKYLNQRIARNEKPKIEELAKRYWPDAKVVVANDTRLTYPEDNDTSITYPEFLKRYPMNIQMIMIYLKGDDYIDGNGDIDEKTEVDKYLAFGKDLAESKYNSSSITWLFLTPQAYNRFEEARHSDDTIDNYLDEYEEKTGMPQIVTRVGYHVDAQGQRVETIEKINTFFDIWKDKRIQGVGQQGG